jgi:hypothetical protein
MTPAIPIEPNSRATSSAPLTAAEGAVTVDSPRYATPGPNRPGIWLHAAAAGLLVLAAAAATVSFTAQYRLVYAARRLPVAAGLEAAIPDAAALVFACLGVALALHGRRAVRARALNVCSAGASVFMNVIAAAPGWRDIAVWAMPPAAYALASDTLIAVIRTSVVARHQGAAAVAGDVTALAVLTGLLLWLLRLSLAPASTLAGFRAWVLAECPVAPGRRAPGVVTIDSTPTALPASVACPPRSAHRRRRATALGQTKTARFLALVAQQHGPLAAVSLGSVGRISAALAPHVDLNVGAARTALRRAVLTAQNGDQR